MDLMLSYIEKFIPTLENFLGFKINFSKGNNQELLIELSGIHQNVYNSNSKKINSILDKVVNTIVDFYEEHKNINYRAVHKQLLMEELACGLIAGNHKNNSSLADFIELIKSLSVKTYEAKNTEPGFIIINKDELDICQILSRIGIKYLKFPDNYGINQMLQDKQTIRLIDSKSLCFVVNSNYTIIGLAQKTKNNKSIYDIMMSRHKKFEESSIKYFTYELLEKELGLNTENNNVADDIKDNYINSIQNFVTTFNDVFKTNFNIDKIDKVLDEEQYKSSLHLYSKELVNYLGCKKLFLDQINKMQDINAGMEQSFKFLEDIASIIKDTADFNSIDFVFVKDKEIFWSSSFEYILTYYNGQWKLRNYFFLRSIIMNFIISQQFAGLGNIIPYEKKVLSLIEKIKYSIPRALDMHAFLKSLSEKNIGALICILEKSNRRKTTIYKKMLRDGRLESEQYKLIIQTNKYHSYNIRGCDPYFFELICSVDGAVIMDYVLNILSFGEIINSENILHSNKTYRGARTKAAIAASDYGLAIKVSEDGDITVFHEQKEIIRI